MNNGPDDTKFEGNQGGSAEPVREGTGAGMLSGDAEDYADPQLEAALRLALRPADVPGGFADRILQRALAGELASTGAAGQQVPAKPTVQPRGEVASTRSGKGKLLHWPQSRLWITGAIAAGLAVGVFEGGLAYRHVREEQQRIVQATQQFQTTERITVHALAQAREQLQKAGVPLSLD